MAFEGGGGGYSNNKSGERYEFEDSATIEGTIEDGQEVELTHYNLSILRKLDDDIEYASSTIIDDYLDELKMLSTTYSMSDEEFRKYKYRPDLFCYDQYGALDLDFIILAINGLNDAKDFDRKVIKYIDGDDLLEVLSYIVNAEEEYIETNREKYLESSFS